MANKYIRETLTEKILRALAPMGGEKSGLWFSHPQIVKRVRSVHNIPDDQGPYRLGHILHLMVMRGYLERARMPNPKQSGKNYIYRLTGKKYKPIVMLHKVDQKGLDIAYSHRGLPKWFRNMLK